MLILKVGADDADHLDLVSKIAGRKGDIGGGTAKGIIGTSERGFDVVKGKGADNENRHKGFG